jgi:hypothetical protein
VACLVSVGGSCTEVRVWVYSIKCLPQKLSLYLVRGTGVTYGVVDGESHWTRGLMGSRDEERSPMAVSEA